MSSPERLAQLETLVEQVRAKRAHLRELRELVPSLPDAPPDPSASECALAAAWERVHAGWTRRVEERPLSDEPLVSIVLAAGADEAWLVRVMLSLVQTWFATLDVEIVIAASSPAQAARIRANAPGVVLVERDDTICDPRAPAAERARGTYLCLLDERMVLSNGWLDRLVTLLEHTPSIGIAAPRVVGADGTFDDGSIATADGRLAPLPPVTAPPDGVRDVDIVPFGALLVRASLFRAMGGFDRRLLGQRYRDAHLCLCAPTFGARVVVQTQALVRASLADDRDGARLAELHRARLATRTSNAHRALSLAARRTRRGEVLLVVVDRLPLHGWRPDSRLFALMRAWRAQGYYVALLPCDFVVRDPAAGALADLGVELLCGPGFEGLDAALAGIVPILDVAWIVGARALATHVEPLRLNAAVRVVYDVDLRTDAPPHTADAAPLADMVTCADADDLQALSPFGLAPSVVDARNAARFVRELRAEPTR